MAAELFGTSLGMMTIDLLIAALGLALTFEFVNGLHDTANASHLSISGID
jgi:inorganic phosphate transporter, PiT family